MNENENNNMNVEDVVIINKPSNDIINEKMLATETGAYYQDEDGEQMERSFKRVRNESESEWITVERKGKKLKESETIEIYISHTEVMPKQFAFAKILKENSIQDIIRVKYINPYKIRVDLINEVSADKLEHCQVLLNKGWRMQRSMERSLSYGIIKYVDLDLTDEMILNNISCNEPAKLIAVSRLNKRGPTEDKRWIPSEAVRLCFKGAYIPPFVFVEGLRIKVERYIFPVTQCAQCWKFGHITKRCPSKKVICPKCGNNHPNCETTSFRCVNCKGNHMALSKTCSHYLKEKKLREIMSEFNCTYRKALTIYVAPSQEDSEEMNFEHSQQQELPQNLPLSTDTPLPCAQSTSTPAFSFAEALKSKGHKSKPTRKLTNEHKQKQQRKHHNFDYTSQCEIVSDNEELLTNQDFRNSESETNRSRNISFGELISRVKDMLFIRDVTMPDKIRTIIKLCIEWLILLVVDNVADWPLLKCILDYFKDG
ncbi:uncharacterized protein LOC123667744 [Melitaea cinxia]|uniref:uncharacterized protein LOC123661807 n=1 Tax=Melitaea cinxia TaxID=113334 RepID=UPI001E270AC3|nr:uncharacterized protein LOC123661807 [Melitaea cinxia]XP_045457540.1 uncharacterized protein LOC123667744 [Melitaea cinxia]